MEKSNNSSGNKFKIIDFKKATMTKLLILLAFLLTNSAIFSQAPGPSVPKKATATLPANQNAAKPQFGTFTDTRDGKTYTTVKIGSQTWMAENLAYKADRGCRAYNNDQNNSTTYGYLYDWEIANQVCPAGWHLPTSAEWEQLIKYLGGPDVAGNKMREKGTQHWDTSEREITNTTGFTALPGGGYQGGEYPEYENIGKQARWWSSTTSKENEEFALWCGISDEGAIGILDYAGNKYNGYSIRCVKNK